MINYQIILILKLAYLLTFLYFCLLYSLLNYQQKFKVGQKLDKHSLLLRFWSNFSYGFCGMQINIIELVCNFTIDRIENRVVFVVLAVILFGYNLGCSETAYSR